MTTPQAADTGELPAQPHAPAGERPLRDRVAVVTGGGRGLGRLLAGALAEAGSDVVVTGRDVRVLVDTAEQLRERGVQARAVVADATVPGAVAQAVRDVVSDLGTIDILVNNAGVGGPVGPFWEVDEHRWRHTMDVNFHGTADACRAVLPLMTARRSGRVINIVSAAGRHRWPSASAYSVSKAAVIKLTENLARELAGHGVSVFSFDPGILALGLSREALDRGPTGDPWEDRISAWFHSQREAGRFTAPEQAARAFLRLAAGAADRLSGEYITADDDIPELARSRARRVGRAHRP